MQFTQDKVTFPKKECLKKKAKVLVCPALFLLLLILQTFNLSMHVFSFRAQSYMQKAGDSWDISPQFFLDFPGSVKKHPVWMP